MSEQQVWPSKALTDDLLADVGKARAFVAGLAHTLHGDELKEAQAAMVAVVGCLDEFVATVQARLSVPTVLREPVAEWPEVREPGQVTADVVRRMRKNAGPGKHRPKYEAPQ